MPGALTAREAETFADPVQFQQIHLGRKLWKIQQDIARSVEANPQTAVRGCHASGKTFEATGGVLHWLVKHPKGIVFTTAPTLRQVKTLWKEIRVAWAESPIIRALLPEPTTTGLEVSPDNYALGASSSTGVNIQGFHGKDVLIICDEAPGIEADIWDAIEGIRAGGRVRVLKLGNPVVPAGDFFDAFGRARAIHNCITISAFDTPNFVNELTGIPLTMDELMELPEDRLDYAPFPFLITRRWVRERYIAWGPNHPKFRSRVLAEFPSQSPYSVFDLSWIEKAKRDPTDRELEMAKPLAIQVGIDVAGSGSDETALCARVGGIILKQKAWHEDDPIGAVLHELHELRSTSGYRMGSVVIDIGGIGFHFAPRIAEFGYDVYGFNAAQRAVDPQTYANGKSEAYFAARSYFKSGEISGLNDDECEAQLSTMLYRETGRGLTEIRSKDDMRKMGVPSPDRAEALIMAFMRVVPREVQMTFGGDGQEYVISPV